LLKAAGFSVKFTPTSGDGGIDIKAHKDAQHIVVQCKNYAGKVGGPEIRDFAGALQYARESSSNTVGWLVAPNGFSESTFQKYHRPGNLELWDFTDIQELVMKTYPAAFDTADEELGVSEH
jgi:restriction endonuclease Mrr